MHSNHQKALDIIQKQTLTHTYQHQLKALERKIGERSVLYRRYIVHPKSNFTLADLQETERTIKDIFADLDNASTGMIWELPLKQLMTLNQQFTQEATTLVRNTHSKAMQSMSSKKLDATASDNKEQQDFAAQIDQLDHILQQYVENLRQIADQADGELAGDRNAQNQFFVFSNLFFSLSMIGFMLLVYFAIGYKLRRSIIRLTHALEDYSLFGTGIPVFKKEKNSEIAALAYAAKSFRDNVVENVIVSLQQSYPTLFQDLHQVIATSKALKITVNEILNTYEDRANHTKERLLSNEKTRIALRSIIKNGEGFLKIVREISPVAKHKQASVYIKNLEALIQEAHTMVVQEQNAAKSLGKIGRKEAVQKRVLELLLELSVKISYVSEQLEKELSSFIQATPGFTQDVVIKRR